MAKKKAKKMTAAAHKKRWISMAEEAMVGKKIIRVRWLHKPEYEAMGWFRSAIVLQLDDGTLLFPSRDDEGNGAGALFGQGPNGEEQTWPVGV